MNTSILTIDPGTRYWGVSVFHGAEIITCMVKNLSAKDSARNRLLETRRIFLKLCRDYAPEILIVERPYDFWESQSPHLESIIKEIKLLSRRERIKVIELSPETVRKVICNDENATKDQIAEVIYRTYPELEGYLEQGGKHRNRYWGRMADSIGLGICYLKSREIPKI